MRCKDMAFRLSRLYLKAEVFETTGAKECGFLWRVIVRDGGLVSGFSCLWSEVGVFGLDMVVLLIGLY
jgi:hypothetical protein